MKSLKESTPTPIAQVLAKRETSESPESEFNRTLEVADMSIRLLALTMASSLRSDSDRRYAIEHGLVRANGMGDWAAVLRERVNERNDLCRELSKCLTQARGDHGELPTRHCKKIEAALDALGFSSPGGTTKNRAWIDVVDLIVRLRNKTRGHGAPDSSFYEDHGPAVRDAVDDFLLACPLFFARWLLCRVFNGNKTVLHLKGLGPCRLDDHDLPDRSDTPSLMIVEFDRGSDEAPVRIEMSELIVADRDGANFEIVNGQWNEKKKEADCLNFDTGRTRKKSYERHSRQPVPLPPSNTAGLVELEAAGDLLGNMPPRPEGYVHRPRLERELADVLMDSRHRVVTLNGIGGTGKTSLALTSIYALGDSKECPFDVVVWCSARDLDLSPDRDRSVRRSVWGVDSMATHCGRILDFDETSEKLAEVLRSPGNFEEGVAGILFVVDNFETVDDPDGLWRFLDEHVDRPNKVLITSRNRHWKGDFPIEVVGMEWAESSQLILEEADRLKIAEIVRDTKGYAERLHEHTSGHPHAMKMLLHHVSIERRATPPKTKISNLDVKLDSLFERTFESLSHHARTVFLCSCAWNSDIPVIGLKAVLEVDGIDVDAGVEECERASLLSRSPVEDQIAVVSVAASLVRRFGNKKLKASEDRLELNQYVSDLKEFPVLATKTISVVLEEWARDYAGSALRAAAKKGSAAETEDEIQRHDAILQSIAEISPEVWPSVAWYREKADLPLMTRYDALRKQAEHDIGESSELFLELADMASKIEAESLPEERLKFAIAQTGFRVQAAQENPDDLVLLSDSAKHVSRFLYEQKEAIPQTKRKIYTNIIAKLMNEREDQLDANQFSQLGWLIWNEFSMDRVDDVRACAEKGLALDPENRHCQNLLSKIEDAMSSW